MLTRRTAVAALSGLLVASRARAQTFPARTVTIVVPYPPGGPVDTLARVIARDAAPGLGQSIVVENRPGGAGTIGSAVVAHAEPDGHTLVLGTNQTHATDQSLLKNCPYDAVKDFTPVAGLAVVQHVLVVRPDLPAANVQELIALSQSAHGADGKQAGLNFGSSGVGSASHLAAALFAKVTGTKMSHVAFPGVAPLINGMLAGYIDASFATLSSVLGQIQGNKLRALAVASATRAAALPDVKTLREQGVDGVEADAWFALFAPAKTPDAAVERLYQAVSAAVNTDTVKSALSAQGFTVALRTPADVKAWLPGEVQKWASVIRDAGIVLQ
jgi:tripartite-type tricarboxylate transporter receptor subunit TctC